MALAHLRLYNICLVAVVVRQCDIPSEISQATNGHLLKPSMRRKCSIKSHSGVFAFVSMAYMSGFLVCESCIPILSESRVL